MKDTPMPEPNWISAEEVRSWDGDVGPWQKLTEGDEALWLGYHPSSGQFYVASDADECPMPDPIVLPTFEVAPGELARAFDACGYHVA